MISSMSVPICNRFHTIRVNNAHLFRGTPFWRPRSRGTPVPTGTKFLPRKTRVLGAGHSEDFVILAWTVLTQYSSVTDGRTNGQTPRPWLRRAKHSTIARKRKVGKGRGVMVIPSLASTPPSAIPGSVSISNSVVYKLYTVRCGIFTRESSYCFQRVLAIAILSVHLSVDVTRGSVKSGAS